MSQFSNYIDSSNLDDQFQSIYKRGHIIKVALLNVIDSLYCVADKD